jgi:hypothetical protein
MIFSYIWKRVWAKALRARTSPPEVTIAAPDAAMEYILEKSPNVRTLVDNGCVHLHAFRGDGSMRNRCDAEAWQDISGCNAFIVHPLVGIPDHT